MTPDRRTDTHRRPARAATTAVDPLRPAWSDNTGTAADPPRPAWSDTTGTAADPPRPAGAARPVGGAPLDPADVAALRDDVLAAIDPGAVHRLDPRARREHLTRAADAALDRRPRRLPQAVRAELVRRTVDDLVGLGVLEPLLSDPTVTEIMVNGPDEVWVERGGRLVREHGLRFPTPSDLRRIIDRIVTGVDRRVDDASPMVDARLPGGERVHVVLPPVALDGPYLTIRRFPHPLPLDALERTGTIDRTGAARLRAFVAARCNVVVSGATGSGKTTLLNALGGCIGADERVVTIEDAAELALDLPHVVGLECRPANVEGAGAVTPRDLVRNALRMRPDRLVIGEVRGGETLDMLQAMNTGHDGSMVTVHANAVGEALLRLETLAAMTELDLSPSTLRAQVAAAFDLCVHLARDRSGRRRITAIAAVVDGPGGAPTTVPLSTHTGDGNWRHDALPGHLADRVRRTEVGS